LVPGIEGGWTRHLPDGEKMFLYDAAEKYKAEGVPLLILAGKEYGSGSSRDWAAKGTLLLGIRVVIAESFERIHRSNLVQMGVLPVQFLDGQNRESLCLTGEERFYLTGVRQALASTENHIKVTAMQADGKRIEFAVRARIDTPQEAEYYRSGGILPYVFRQILTSATAAG
jgi:aconitate hydratase